MKIIKLHEKGKERKESTYTCTQHSHSQTRLCFRGLRE